jgi:hypothetical protein
LNREKLKPESLVIITLTSIIAIGIIGIPYGDPRFMPIAVLFELGFIALIVFVVKEYTKALYVCIILAGLIIIGNSITGAHIHRMMTLVKPINTIVLIIGGYILQGLLIYASASAIVDKRKIIATSYHKY